MATGANDFQSYPVGTALVDDHDWTDLWSSGNDYVMTSGATPVGDRFARFDNASNNHSVAVWDAAPSNTGRVQLLLLVRRSSNTNMQNGVIARAGGASQGAGDGVNGMFRNNGSDLRWRQYVNGTITNGGESGHGIEFADWLIDFFCFLRVDYDGTTIRAKAWREGDEEPASWAMDSTITYTDAGALGIFMERFGASDRHQDIAYFAYGTDGDAAPMPGAAEPEPPWTLTVNTEGQGTVVKDPDEADYADEAQVELTATPDSGWQVADPLWTGPDAPSNTNENPTTITMDADKELTANFEEEPPLATPGNVQVTVTSRTSATVTWDDVAEADVFQVEARVRSGANE